MIPQAAEGRIGHRRIRRVDRQLDIAVFGYGHQLRIDRTEALPPGIQLLVRRRALVFSGSGDAFGPVAVPAATRRVPTFEHPRESVAVETLPGDRHPGCGENLERIDRVFQLDFTALLAQHKLLGHVRQCHAVKIQPEGADLLFDLEQFVKIGITLLCDAGKVVARTTIQTIDPQLGHIAQIRFRQIAVPNGYFKHSLHLSLLAPTTGPFV